MCTTCSECVVGVKTNLCNVHTRPCTSAQNTCSKVHVLLTVGLAHTHPCIYACTCMHMHMGAYACPRQEVTVWWVGAWRPPRWRTCRYGRSTPGSKRPCKHVARIRQRNAQAVPCIYAQSLQVNLPNPAVCHSTLRLPLRGGSRSRTETPHRPYILIVEGRRGGYWEGGNGESIAANAISSSTQMSLNEWRLLLLLLVKK